MVMMLLEIQDLSLYLTYLRLVSIHFRLKHKSEWNRLSSCIHIYDGLWFSSQGSWIVKQSVGKKSCLIGHALEVQYYRGTNYLEVHS